MVDFIKKQKFEKMEDDLDEELEIGETKPEGNRNGEAKTVKYSDKIDLDSIQDDEHGDALYEEAKNIVIQSGKASSSLLQRRLRVGYSRAARLIDMLEENGIIGQADGAKPREILVAGENSTTNEDFVDDQAVRDKWQM